MNQSTMANIDDFPNSPEPHILKTYNLEQDAYLISSKGFTVIGEIDRETNVSQLVLQSKKINADLIIYEIESNNEQETPPDRYIPGNGISATKDNGSGKSLWIQSGNDKANLNLQVADHSSYSDEYTSKAVFFIKPE
jgi:hypothetical protein